MNQAQTLAELGREFQRRGHYTPRTHRVLIELGVHVLLTVGGMLVFFEAPAWWLRALGVLVSSAGSFGISTNSHAASHYSTAKHAGFNRALTLFGYPFALGLSATYWWHKHCVQHHQNPNVPGLDDDIDLLPMFALTQRERAAAGPIARLYYSIQWLALPLAIALNALNMQRQGWLFLIGRLRSPKAAAIHLIDLGCLCAHLAVWLVLPACLFTKESALLYYALRLVLLGYASFAIFVPAHFPAEAQLLDAATAARDPVARQILTTLNFRVGAIAGFFTGSLEYQIEHHLFPRMDHTHYSEISADVRAFCEAHGYPYRVLGWGEALAKSLLVFHHPKQMRSSAAVDSQCAERCGSEECDECRPSRIAVRDSHP